MAKRRYRLLHGTHDESIPELRDKDGKIVQEGVKVRYKRGDVFESEYDLAKPEHNGGLKGQTAPINPAFRKFELINDDGSAIVSAPTDGLENNTVKELQEIAMEEELDLDEMGLTRKADIIAAIRQARRSLAGT